MKKAMEAGNGTKPALGVCRPSLLSHLADV